MSNSIVDIIVVAAANFLNIVLASMFIARVRGPKWLESVTSGSALFLIPVMAAAALWNLLNDREWWTFVFPAMLTLFLLLELLLDYILKIDFRNTRLLWPYLLIYYLSMMAMIGYSFGVGEAAGFITLATYFICLGATWYSYSRVKHGRSEAKLPT